MSTAAFIPANGLSVALAATRYDCSTPAGLQNAMREVNAALKATMTNTGVYTSTPPPDQPVNLQFTAQPLETQFHPYVIAALLHNLARELSTATQGPVSVPNDSMIHINGEWQYVAVLAADVVNLNPRPVASSPALGAPYEPQGDAPAPSPDEIYGALAAGDAPISGTVVPGGLPEITLSPDQKGATAGRPRKSLFQTAIPLRTKGITVPAWWPELRETAKLMFVTSPAQAIYTPGSRKTTPPMVYMTLVELLQSILAGAPRGATVDELLQWLRSVESLVADSDSAPAIEQFRKALRDKKGGGGDGDE